MPGLACYLGAGLSLLGVVYTIMVFVLKGEIFGGERRPYLYNGVALCILGVSLIGREFWLPRPVVYLLWAAAAILAVQATREIQAQKPR